MATCHFCKTTILFGGVKQGSFRYCKENCRHSDLITTAATALSQEEVDDMLFEAHESPCPLCHGPGPIDVHDSHRILSLLVATSWSTRRIICCNRCGTKRKMADVMYCFLLGWWAVSGLIVTPIQIGKNIHAICRPPDPLVPSKAFEEIIRVQIVANRQAELATAVDARSASPFTPPAAGHGTHVE